MKDSELQALFEQAAEKGAIVALIHVDAYAASEDKAKELLVSHIAMMSKDHGVIYCKGEIEPEAIKVEDVENQFSAIGEITIVAENLQSLLLISLKYAPIAIEILKPSKIELGIEEAQNILLDASQASQQFASYYVANTMTPEQKENYKKAMEKRAESGKQLMDKTNENKIY